VHIFIRSCPAKAALKHKLAAELGSPDLATTHETKHEPKRAQAARPVAANHQAGRAVQQAAEAQKAPVKKADSKQPSSLSEWVGRPLVDRTDWDVSGRRWLVADALPRRAEHGFVDFSAR
jgi:hypothetical protein